MKLVEKQELRKKALGGYSQSKINTFISVFPISNPKFVLAVMLDEPKTNKDYIYNYRDGSNLKFKGTPLILLVGPVWRLQDKLLIKLGLF